MFNLVKNKKGFTLIEIVIVIVIIAILAAILVPNLLAWVDKAKLTKNKEELRMVAQEVNSRIVEIYDKQSEISEKELQKIADESVKEIGAKGKVSKIAYEKDGALHINYTSQDDFKIYYCSKGGTDDCGATSEYGEGTLKLK